MLRPIDLQQVVMQMEQAEKVQRVEQHHPDMQQRYLELQIKEEKKLRQKKVADAQETNKTLIRNKQDREPGQERRAGAGHREDMPQAGPEEDQEEAPQGGHINITV